MYTVSDIIKDIGRGCTANNMTEDKFSYRIVYFVGDGDDSIKRYADTSYHNLRKSLEYIIKKYLSLTNGIVIAQTTVLKNGRCVRLQSRSYAFSLDAYFRQITGECANESRNRRLSCFIGP